MFLLVLLFVLGILLFISDIDTNTINYSQNNWGDTILDGMVRNPNNNTLESELSVNDYVLRYSGLGTGIKWYDWSNFHNDLTLMSGTWNASGGIDFNGINDYGIVDDNSSKFMQKSNSFYHRDGIGDAIVGDKIYVIGGREDSPATHGVNYTEIYNITSDIYSTGADMPAALADTTCISYNTDIYCFGGYVDSSIPSNLSYKYNTITDSWSSIPSMPTTRWGQAAVLIGNKVYIAGGQLEDRTQSNVTEIYNIITNSWTSGTNLTFGCQGIMGVNYSGNAYFICGGSGLSNRFAKYNTTDNTVTNVTNLPVSTRWGAVGIIGDLLYVLGGFSSSASGLVQTYNFTSGYWNRTAIFSQNIYGSTRDQIVYNNKMYVIEGQGCNGCFYNTTWEYNPFKRGLDIPNQLTVNILISQDDVKNGHYFFNKMSTIFGRYIFSNGYFEILSSEIDGSENRMYTTTFLINHSLQYLSYSWKNDGTLLTYINGSPRSVSKILGSWVGNATYVNNVAYLGNQSTSFNKMTISKLLIYDKVLNNSQINESRDNYHQSNVSITTKVSDAGQGKVWNYFNFSGIDSGNNVSYSLYINGSKDNNSFDGWVIIDNSLNINSDLYIPNQYRYRFVQFRLYENTSYKPETDIIRNIQLRKDCIATIVGEVVYISRRKFDVWRTNKI